MVIGIILAVVCIVFVVAFKATGRSQSKVTLSKGAAVRAAAPRRTAAVAAGGPAASATAARPGTTGATRAAVTRRAEARPAEAGPPVAAGADAAEAADTGQLSSHWGKRIRSTRKCPSGNGCRRALPCAGRTL